MICVSALTCKISIVTLAVLVHVYYHYISLANINKKLSYCCDSRSYCMQYFHAIHCDRNISTSE